MDIDNYSRGFARRLDTDSMGIVTYGNAATRTFSIAVKGGQSNFKFKIQGRFEYKTTTHTLACPDVTGTYYWYFDIYGDLQVALNGTIGGDTFVRSAICGMAYYNKEEGTFSGAVDEQHGYIYNPEEHLVVHLTNGFTWMNGNTGTIEGLTDGGDTFIKLNASLHFDEDIPISIEELATLPFGYIKTQSGVDGWVLTAADNKIGHIVGGDTYISYNGDVGGGIMGLIECTNSTDYVIMMVLKTNLSGNFKAFKAIGTQTYPSRNSARAGLNNALAAIKLRGFPSAEAEWQQAYICKRNGTLEDDGYGNTHIDLRGRKLA